MSRSYEKFYCLHSWDLWGEQDRPSKADPEQAKRLAWTFYCKLGVGGGVRVPIYGEGLMWVFHQYQRREIRLSSQFQPIEGTRERERAEALKSYWQSNIKKWVRLFITWFYFHHLDILYIWSWILCIVWGRDCFIYFNLRISKWPSCVYLSLPFSTVLQCHLVINQTSVYL